MTTSRSGGPLTVALIGGGRMGAFHAETLARRLPGVRLAAIADPARTHAGLVEAAARAGKAVYCEKPMALTLADADRAIDAAHEAGVPLQVGFNRRFDAGFRIDELKDE